MQGKSNGLAFFPTAIPRLLGTFDLGHLYLGGRRRGYDFLFVVAALYMIVAVGVFVPGVVPAPVMAPGFARPDAF
ncbi:MAG: hypothetical protein LYZ69_02015 [Nitrososphaerales archaeon]|nr:hypothetical protein [Nitrososphaerales archaeon]